MTVAASAGTDPTPVAEAPRPFWKNPFVIGLAIGIVVLTVLPLLQRQALHAPAPVGQLPSWQVGEVGSAALSGKVWIAEVCVQRACETAKLVKHVADLAQRIEVVAFAGAPAAAAPEWKVVDVTTAAPQFAPLQAAFTDAGAKQGATNHTAAALPDDSFILVDQTGAIRGLWPKTDLGAGNVINAARLLARYGPNP